MMIINDDDNFIKLSGHPGKATLCGYEEKKFLNCATSSVPG